MRFCTASTTLIAAVFLAAAPLMAASVLDANLEIRGERSAAGKGAAQNLDCTSPVTGNVCLTVNVPGIAATIPDNGTLTRSVQITNSDLAGLGLAGCDINSINVALEIEHSFVGDLIATLDPVVLYNPSASCSANYVDAVFSDAAILAPNTCSYPRGSSLRPDQSLASGFAGRNVAGVYTLQIQDAFALDTGNLDSLGFAIDATCQTTPGGVPCIEGPNTLCLVNDRFKVEIDWRSSTASGSGRAVELTPDTGYFWFFDQNNVEMVLKVLNACSFADRFWVFAGGLTNVEIDIRVTDTDTGTTNTYINPINTPFQPIQDTNAFATCP